MQEVLMLLAAAVLSMSVFKTATLEPVTSAHFESALSAQSVGSEAQATAKALLIDAYGPAGSQGGRSYKCMSFDVDVAPPDKAACRSFRMAVGGIREALIEGTLCPRSDGAWGEAPGPGMVTSTPLNRGWHDAILKKGASLYAEPSLTRLRSKFEWPDAKVQTGGFSFREAQTFALVRMPSGESHYVLKNDLITDVK
ncbi:MAG: hypothetical protein WCF85_17535 [Rhodospirillaceae bacterium]